MGDNIVISRKEYGDMMDYIERLQETLDVVSNKEVVNRLNLAISRMESGEYISKEEIVE